MENGKTERIKAKVSEPVSLDSSVALFSGTDDAAHRGADYVLLGDPGLSSSAGGARQGLSTRGAGAAVGA